MPTWGADLSALVILMIFTITLSRLKISILSGNDVPENIKNTFEKLGIPQAEQKFLAGVGAQFDSEVIYKSLKKKWADQGCYLL